MATLNTIPTRVHKEFKKLLNDSKLNKIKLGKADVLKPPTDARMTLAITRLFKKYPNLKQELELSEFK